VLEKKVMIAVNTPMMPNANKKNGILYPLSGQSDAHTNAEKYVGLFDVLGLMHFILH